MSNENSIYNPFDKNKTIDIKLEHIDEILLKFIYSQSFSNNNLIKESFFTSDGIHASLLKSKINLNPNYIEERLFKMVRGDNYGVPMLFYFKMIVVSAKNKLSKRNIYTLNKDFKQILDSIEDKIIIDHILKLYNVFKESFEKDFIIIIEEQEPEVQSKLKLLVLKSKLKQFNINIIGNPISIVLPDFGSSSNLEYKNLTISLLREIENILKINKISEDEVKKIIKTNFKIPGINTIQEPFSDQYVKEYVVKVVTFANIIKNYQLSLVSSLALVLISTFQEQQVQKVNTEESILNQIKNYMLKSEFENKFNILDSNFINNMINDLNIDINYSYDEFINKLIEQKELEIFQYNGKYYFISHKGVKSYYLDNFSNKSKMGIFLELFKYRRKEFKDKYNLEWYKKFIEKYKDIFEINRLKRIVDLIDYKPLNEKLKSLPLFKRFIAMIILLILPNTKEIFGISIEDEWEKLVKDELDSKNDSDLKEKSIELKKDKITDTENKNLLNFIKEIVSLKGVYTNEELEIEIKSALKNSNYKKIFNEKWNGDTNKLINDKEIFLSCKCENNSGKNKVSETYYFLNPFKFYKVFNSYYIKTKDYILKKSKSGNLTERLLFPELIIYFDENVIKAKRTTK